MTRKILKQIICVFILFMAFSPMQLKAQNTTEPAPIFGDDGTVNNPQTGVNDIKAALGNSGVTGTDNISDLVLKYVNFEWLP